MVSNLSYQTLEQIAEIIERLDILGFELEEIEDTKFNKTIAKAIDALSQKYAQIEKLISQ